MRIALFSDVHANRAALRAVLHAIASEGVDAAFSLGDLVGRGPDPEAVVRIVADRGIETLKGNWDDWVAGGSGWDARPKRKAHVESARSMMKKRTQKSLSAHPETRALELEGTRLFLAHGSPRDPQELLLPEMNDDRIRAAIEGVEADVVAVAHSHRPFIRRIGPRLVVNTGTVGYAFGTDPRATFAILEIAKGLQPDARIIHVPYRLERTIASLERRIRSGKVQETIARSYKVALLGDATGAPEPLAPSDRGSDALVKLLAARIRALYKAWPEVEDGAAGELLAAFEIARPMINGEGTKRRTRRLKRLERMLGEARAPAAIEAELVHFELVPVFERVLEQRRAALHSKYGEARMIDDGLALMALTMHGDDSVSLSEAALVASRRILKRLKRRKDSIGLEEADAIRRIAGAALILSPAFPGLGFEPARPIALAWANAVEEIAAAHTLREFVKSPLTERRMKGRNIAKLRARADALVKARREEHMPEIEVKKAELTSRFRKIVEEMA